MLFYHCKVSIGMLQKCCDIANKTIRMHRLTMAAYMGLKGLCVFPISKQD